MPEQNNNPEFNELMESLLNETISPQQHARLEEILLSNPDAQRDYHQYLDLHLALDRISAIDAESHPLADEPIFKKSLVQPETAKHRTRHWIAGSLTVVIAAVAVLLVVFLNGIQPPQVTSIQMVEESEPVEIAPPAARQPAVRLSQAANAELVREFVPELDSPMQLDHEYALVNGMLELTFAHGATAIIKSPAVFTLISSERMDLKFGNCSVYAPDGAQGFQVVTPQNRIVDLGTRFSVEVGDNGSSEVQVVEGAAEVYSHENPETMSLLKKGEAARSTTDAKCIVATQFDSKQFHRGLPDRVISYEATEEQPGKGVRDLLCLTVQRNGERYTYSVDELIGIEVTDFYAYSNNNNVACDRDLPERITDLLAKDKALNTGLINFDRPLDTPFSDDYERNKHSRRTGMAIRFNRPVQNGPGPDVVLFEVQSVAYPLEGDHFRVSPIHPGNGLRSHIVTNFDISMKSANARQVANFAVYAFQRPVKSLADLTRTPERHGKMTLPFFALAVGIDLSDLGYPEQAEVDGLFFEDAHNNKLITLDPVFIAGLPSLTIK